MSDKPKKKFGERVKNFLKIKAPEILDGVGEILPDNGGLGILKNLITKSSKLSAQDKEYAFKLIELDIKQMEEVSERWQADMASDSWLSKNVRPIILMASWIILILIVIAGWFEIVLNDSYISMFEVLAITVNAAYFGGRTFEKYTSIKY